MAFLYFSVKVEQHLGEGEITKDGTSTKTKTSVLGDGKSILIEFQQKHLKTKLPTSKLATTKCIALSIFTIMFKQKSIFQKKKFFEYTLNLTRTKK